MGCTPYFNPENKLLAGRGLALSDTMLAVWLAALILSFLPFAAAFGYLSARLLASPRHCGNCAAPHSSASRLPSRQLSTTRLRAWGGAGGPGGTTKKGKTGCKLCSGTGGVACVPCAGKGVDRKKGDVMQRWMCKACFGFGSVSCSCTGGKGLTPEQTGER